MYALIITGDVSWVYGYDLETSRSRRSEKKNQLYHHDRKGYNETHFNKGHGHLAFRKYSEISGACLGKNNYTPLCILR